jgi:hypothetical protein
MFKAWEQEKIVYKRKKLVSQSKIVTIFIVRIFVCEKHMKSIPKTFFVSTTFVLASFILTALIVKLL